MDIQYFTVIPASMDSNIHSYINHDHRILEYACIEILN
jgi:hypothetical protein